MPARQARAKKPLLLWRRGCTAPFWALALAWIASGAAASAERPDPLFAVSHFEVEYAEPHPDLPELGMLVPFEVELAPGPLGWTAPTDASGGSKVQIGNRGNRQDAGSYHASAIAAITAALLERVQQQGLMGVLVTPHPADIDVRSERDLRPPGRRALRLQVSIGRARELRSVAVGDRIDEGWTIDNPAHRSIRRASPIQPAAAAREGTTDLIVERELEDYLFRLNRHPGRRVEAALAGAEGGGVALDLRVHEARPWFAYFQSSNTGTPQTAVWQQRFGFVHRQVTGRDDILSLEYTNAGGNDVHVVQGSYEAPWFSSRRPDWWKSNPDELFWQRWLHRDALPWWGADRLRWRVDGSWSRFDAKSLLASVENVRGDEWNLGSRVIYEAFQWHNLFLDVFAGTRMRKVSVLNENFGGNDADEAANELFFLPEVGIEVERIQETSTLRARASFEVNVADTFDQELQNLGRQEVDGDWQLIRYDLGVSQYLEPLLFPEAWEDPSTPSTSTLAHEVAMGFRGQYAFDYRLIPQASQVVGGQFSVRGYDPSASVGDSVWIASAEYRFHVPLALPIQREPLQVPGFGDFRAAPQQVYGRPDWDFVIKAFVDAGKTIRNSPRDGTPRPVGETNEFLLSAGVGGEFRFRHNLTVRVDWGHALESTQRTKRGNNEVHVLINVVY